MMDSILTSQERRESRSENTVLEITDNLSNDERFYSHAESKQNLNLDII